MNGRVATKLVLGACGLMENTRMLYLFPFTSLCNYDVKTPEYILNAYLFHKSAAHSHTLEDNRSRTLVKWRFHLFAP
jgi:hypothetical protein